MSAWILKINVLDELNAAKTLYFSDVPYVDSSQVYYEDRMIQPAMVQVSPSDGGVLKVFSNASVGQIELINNDGGLNYLVDYALDNGDFLLLFVDDSNTENLYMKGKIESMHDNDSSIFLTIKSSMEVLTRPHTSTKYAGTNSLPAGVEGVAGDIKGNIKPKVFGKVNNAQPVFVNTSRLIYQFSDRDTCTVSAVYDKGASLTLGTTYTKSNFSTFETTAVTAGYFNRCMGFVKLGSTPLGTVTGDCSDSTTYAGDVFEAVLSELFSQVTTSYSSNTVGTGSKTFTVPIGLSINSGDTIKIVSVADSANFIIATVTSYISTALIVNGLAIGGNGAFSNWNIGYTLTLNSTSKTTLDAVGEVGIYVSSETSTAQILDLIAKSCGAHWYFIENVVHARLTQLATISVFELTDSEITSVERSGIGLGTNNLPIESVVIDYAKIETVQQETELVGSVTAARKAVLSQQYRTVTVKDAPTLTRHPLATSLKIESALIDESAATSVATRLLNLTKGRCDTIKLTAIVYDIPVFSIGDGVTVYYSRIGYDAGRLMTVIGYEIDAKRKILTLELIG